MRVLQGPIYKMWLKSEMCSHINYTPEFILQCYQSSSLIFIGVPAESPPIDMRSINRKNCKVLGYANVDGGHSPTNILPNVVRNLKYINI